MNARTAAMPSLRPVRFVLALVMMATALPGCAVVAVAGAVVGATIDVGAAVVSTTVRVTGKVIEKTIDLVTPGSSPSP